MSLGSTAKRFLQVHYWVEHCLAQPRKSGQADYELFVNCCRRRELAAELIGWGCEPRFSERIHGAGFRQAGVVAPPDSLMGEKAAGVAC